MTNKMIKYLNYNEYDFLDNDNFNKFFKDYIFYLKSIFKKNNIEIVKKNKGFYYFSLFLKKNDKYIYFCISDVRFFKNEWFNNILIRICKNENDFKGSQNHYTNLNNIIIAINNLCKGF